MWKAVSGRKLFFGPCGPSAGTIVARMQGDSSGPTEAYIRSKDQYRVLFDKHGFEFLSSSYPPFTTGFLEQYRWQLPSEDAEYLIMAMRKV